MHRSGADLKHPKARKVNRGGEKWHFSQHECSRGFGLHDQLHFWKGTDCAKRKQRDIYYTARTTATV